MLVRIVGMAVCKNRKMKNGIGLLVGTAGIDFSTGMEIK